MLLSDTEILEIMTSSAPEQMVATFFYSLQKLSILVSLNLIKDIYIYTDIVKIVYIKYVLFGACTQGK